MSAFEGVYLILMLVDRLIALLGFLDKRKKK